MIQCEEGPGGLELGQWPFGVQVSRLGPVRLMGGVVAHGAPSGGRWGPQAELPCLPAPALTHLLAVGDVSGLSPRLGGSLGSHLTNVRFFPGTGAFPLPLSLPMHFSS